MQIHILGSAAGGGFPQWNCNCANCQAARSTPARAWPRMQSCVAVSAEGRRWFLVNASPDVRFQIEVFPPLLPSPGQVRGTGVAGVLVTNADLDHTLGLFHLRESGPLVVHATETVRNFLNAGLRLDAVLGTYGGLEWRVPPKSLSPLIDSDGNDSGLDYLAFALQGKPPRFAATTSKDTDEHTGKHTDQHTNAVVGFGIVDRKTGKRLVCVPDLAVIDAEVAAQIDACDLLLIDGTFFQQDEMQLQGVGTTTAAGMGHLPISGRNGTLSHIARLDHVRRVYIHINNTNPILLQDSPQRREVESHGVTIGYDGMHLEL